jgi:hypothetical protein
MRIKKKRAFWGLTSAIRSTIHDSNVSVDEIAKKLTRSPNLIYKYGMDGSGAVALPAALITPLIKATKNALMLKVLARENGFILIREPRGSLSKKDRIELASEVQLQCNGLVNLIIKNDTDKTPVINDLQKFIEHLAGVKRTLLKDVGQIDLFMENS